MRIRLNPVNWERYLTWRRFPHNLPSYCPQNEKELEEAVEILKHGKEFQNWWHAQQYVRGVMHILCKIRLSPDGIWDLNDDQELWSELNGMVSFQNTEEPRRS